MESVGGGGGVAAGGGGGGGYTGGLLKIVLKKEKYPSGSTCSLSPFLLLRTSLDYYKCLHYKSRFEYLDLFVH